MDGKCCFMGERFEVRVGGVPFSCHDAYVSTLNDAVDDIFLTEHFLHHLASTSLNSADFENTPIDSFRQLCWRAIIEDVSFVQ